MSLRYIRPYKIVERVGLVTYRLSLLEKLSRIHDMFNVSMLHKYFLDLLHVLENPRVALKSNLPYEEQAIQNIDRREQVFHTETI